MRKTFSEYSSFLGGVNKKKVPVDKHHIVPLQIFGPDMQENIADVLQDEHKQIHNTLDISGRYFSGLLRKQRKRENGHILLTESDIEGRAEIQNLYFEDVHKLPTHLKDMHDVKTGQLLSSEVSKFNRLTGESYEVELGDTLKNIGMYNNIQKEISKEIYKKIKK